MSRVRQVANPASKNMASEATPADAARPATLYERFGIRPSRLSAESTGDPRGVLMPFKPASQLGEGTPPSGPNSTEWDPGSVNYLCVGTGVVGE